MITDEFVNEQFSDYDAMSENDIFTTDDYDSIGNIVTLLSIAGNTEFGMLTLGIGVSHPMKIFVYFFSIFE